MPALLLKALASALTLVTAALSALYVTMHVKNPTAPLHPWVVGGRSVAVATGGGRLHLTPSVQGAGVAPVTSTYAS